MNYALTCCNLQLKIIRHTQKDIAKARILKYHVDKFKSEEIHVDKIYLNQTLPPITCTTKISLNPFLVSLLKKGSLLSKALSNSYFEVEIMGKYF